MRDPVILPSSRITVDRPIIQRHLLSDNVSLSNTMMITDQSHLSFSEDFGFVYDPLTFAAA